MIISRTPFRISFFGGGTDYPAWYRQHGGSVIGMTIDKYCYISCRALPPFFEHKHRIVYSKVELVKSIDEIQHPAVKGILKAYHADEGLEIHHDGDLPSRSGMGSSSAFTVGLIHCLKALHGAMISKRELAVQAVHVEQEILKENVGSQDQILTAYGGLNRIDFNRDDSFVVTPVIMDKERVAALQSHMMLFFTGFSRIASEIAKSQIQNMEKRKGDIQAMSALVEEAMLVLQSRSVPITQFGKLLRDYWQYKRGLSDCISNPDLDEIYQAGIDAGAIGGKLLGAGGGGFMLFFVRPEDQAKVKERLHKLVHVNFRIDYTGSKIVIYEPNNFQ
jgi:D-glycero-alpha-D-manno-heptose-7-phosphate kinase